MKLTLTLTDDQETAYFDLLPSPFTKSRDIGSAEVKTQSGDIYTDFVYRKFNFEYKWAFLTEAEYAQLEGFFNRQFTLNKYPTITIPSLGIENMVVRMQLSEQNIVNNCGMVEDVTVSFRETTQQSYTPQPVPPVIGDLVYMQDFATLTEPEMASVINSMVEEQVYTLKDSRDQQDYPITKAKGGFVLMCKNLRIGSNEKETVLKAADSDFEGEDITLPQGSIEGFNEQNRHYLYIDDTYGGHYPYFTATAEQGTQEFTGAANQSILPKGWTLMTDEQLTQLILAYGGDNAQGSAALRAAPLNFQMNGSYYNGVNSNIGRFGYYRTSRTSGNDSANLLYLENTRAYNRGLLKYVGLGIRGILRTGGGDMRPIIEQLTYMQDVTICDFDILAASMELEKVYTLTDRRNSVQYKIALLKDGNIWMLDDLRIANYRCTPEDTDITEGFFQISESTSGNYPSGSTAETIAVRVEENAAYYSWAAATAGCKPADGAALISIMPKGWTLPTGADFEKLIQFYPTSKDIMAEPAPNFKRTGFWNTSGIANRNQIYCWSSTVTDGSNPDFLIEPNSGNLYVRGQTAIGNGFAIRGIVRKKEPEE